MQMPKEYIFANDGQDEPGKVEKEKNKKKN